MRAGVIGVFAGAVLGYDTQMDAGAVLATSIKLVTLGDLARATSKSLWYLLVTWFDGNPLDTVEPNKIALEAWRQLNLEYEARMGNRFTAMLRFILDPQSKWWSGLLPEFDSVGSHRQGIHLTESRATVRQHQGVRA